MIRIFFYIFIVLFPSYFVNILQKEDCHKTITSNQKYSRDFILGKTDAPTDTLFMQLPGYCTNYGNQYMLKSAGEAFLKMYDAAKKDGIKLSVISAYRSYDVQKWLWESSWNKYRHQFSDDLLLSKYILNYLAMPGTSRHHWGTEVDLCSTSLWFFDSEYGKKVYNWLNTNASDYGFYQPYQEIGNSREKGYNEEKWHWSYGPEASLLMNEFAESVNYADFNDFKGSGTAPLLNVIEYYVLSVEPYTGN